VGAGVIGVYAVQGSVVVMDYTAMAAMAKRLIDANGRTVTVVKNGTTPQNSEQPWRGLADYPAVSVTGLAAFVPGSSVATWRVTLRDNIKFGANYALFPASDDAGNQLEFFDEILDNGVRWKIVNAEIIGPTTVRLLYLFEVAR